MKKPLIFISAFCVLFLTLAKPTHAATAYGLSFTPIAGESDIPNGPNLKNLMAVNTNGAALTANGINFLGMGRNGIIGNYAFSHTSSTTTGVGNASGEPTYIAGHDLYNLFYDCTHVGLNAGNNARFAFGGLEEGKTYTLQLYGRQWGTGAREHAFSFSSTADGKIDELILGPGNSYPAINDTYIINQNFPGNSWDGMSAPFALNYTFVAGSNTLNVFMNALASGHGWHNYGWSLYEHTDVLQQQLATKPVIKNGSFELDPAINNSHGGEHGYLSEERTGLITGWTASRLDRVGLGPTINVGTGTNCYDFVAADKTIPDGSQCVFLQCSGNGAVAAAISQDVYGFEPGKYYQLAFHTASRGTQTPRITLDVGDLTLIKNKDISGDFRKLKRTFKASDYMQGVTFTNSRADGDHSLLLDAISLVEIPMFRYFGDNFSVKTGSAVLNASDNDAPGRFSGEALPVNYVKFNGSANSIVQLTGPDGLNLTNRQGLFPNTLAIQAEGDTGIRLDHNFKDHFDPAVGALYEVSFRVNPLYCTQDGTLWNGNGWGAVVIGGSAANEWVNTSGILGLLIRNNGGMQIFGVDGGTVSKDAGFLTPDDDGWYDVTLSYWVNGWAGDPGNLPGTDLAVWVDLFINDVYVNDLLGQDLVVSAGFKNNYISFLANAESRGSNSHLYTFFDDISVRSSAVPEPATWVLLLLGAAGVGFLRKR